MTKSGLFSEFPEVTAKQWKQKIQMDLKGADYNETLVWESLEGINVKPFYHPEDLENISTYPLPKNHDWSVGQSIYAGDAQKANAKAQEILKKGVESLIFTVPNEEIDFDALFSGIILKDIQLYFNFEFLALEPIRKLVSLLKSKNAKAHLNVDIIGHLAKEGNWYHTLEKDHDIFDYLVKLGTSDISLAGFDISHYQNAGANMVQQLAYGMAHANEYLNHVSSSGLEKSFPVTFTVAVGSNYFFEIAKLRALRWLWNTLAPAYNLKNQCHILAIPSKRNKTLYDYNVNMLRTTSECMSAVLGGADTVCNLPYDALYHKDNEFGQRIARNQLLLLKEESYLAGASQIATGFLLHRITYAPIGRKSPFPFQAIGKRWWFFRWVEKGDHPTKNKGERRKGTTAF